MNPATHGAEVSASAPVLYMALELSNKTWRLALSDGAKRRQVSVPAADLAKLASAVAKAKERFGMPATARVLSCYEAGRDGFWLHRHLISIGIENEVIDAASIEVSRRLRHVKTDRLDGERLLAKLIRRPGRHALQQRGQRARAGHLAKAGKRRVRARIIEIAWLWLRFQPRSALSQWYQARFASGGARMLAGIGSPLSRRRTASWKPRSAAYCVNHTPSGEWRVMPSSSVASIWVPASPMLS